MQFILIIILTIVIIYALKYFSGKAPGKPSSLEKKYISLSGQPPHIAKETLNRHIERLKKKSPGRSRKWYLEKIIYDLEKDR